MIARGRTTSHGLASFAATTSWRVGCPFALSRVDRYFRKGRGRVGEGMSSTLSQLILDATPGDDRELAVKAPRIWVANYGRPQQRVATHVDKEQCTAIHAVEFSSRSAFTHALRADANVVFKARTSTATLGLHVEGAGVP